MEDMIEQKISDPEPWTNKILCRYRDAPPVKQFLRDGEDRVLVAEITRLRQLLSEAEKREREVRATALEEAARIADTEEELPGEPSKLVVSAMEAAGTVGNARAAVRTTKASIAKRIRALQPEER